jgi:hypothetical protein
MIQRSQHARFAFEARHPIAVGGELCGQKLERDVSSELRVSSTVHLAHTALA